MSPVGKEKPRDRSHHQVEAGCSENESSLAKEKGADVLFKGKQTFGSHLVCLLSLKWNLPSAWLASSLLVKPLEPSLLSFLSAGSWALPFRLWTSDSSVEWLYQPATKDVCSFRCTGSWDVPTSALPPRLGSMFTCFLLKTRQMLLDIFLPTINLPLSEKRKSGPIDELGPLTSSLVGQWSKWVAGEMLIRFAMGCFIALRYARVEHFSGT